MQAQDLHLSQISLCIRKKIIPYVRKAKNGKISNLLMRNMVSPRMKLDNRKFGDKKQVISLTNKRAKLDEKKLVVANPRWF